MKLQDLNTGISKIEELEITKTNYPFSSAERYCSISESGYTEKEFYMHGTSNVYFTKDDGSIGIKYKAAPYVNRFILRCPENPSDFSGNVIVEIINPTSFMEIERMWILGHKQFMRSGDIYVGITSKPNTIPKLLEFNAQRYQKLSWKNPTSELPFPFTDEDLQKAGGILPDQNISYETGLVWDMLSDLAILLRNPVEENPLIGYTPKHLTLTGWSQSANYLIRYINDFVPLRQDLPLYDGYLIAGPPRHCPAPVNQYETLSCAQTETVRLRHTDKPCIVLQTESENALMGAYNVVRNDGDEPEFLCRHYDITGSSHDTLYSLISYYQNDPDLVRIHMLPGYSGKHDEPNNYPLEILIAAAFRNLSYWIETGTAPSPCDRIPTDHLGNNKRDAFGNSTGGLRTCLLDYPTGRFYFYSDIEKNSSGIFPDSDKDILFGHEEPFPKEMLKTLYGSLSHYRELVERHTDIQILKGYVVREDRETLIEEAMERARRRGL